MDFGTGMVVSGLGTPFTVLGAFAGTGIDNAARVERRLPEVACNFSGSLVEGFPPFCFGQLHDFCPGQ